MYTSFTDWDSGLAHHGTRGMKWGRRRYQNEDGSLTALGREHYGVGEGGNKKLEREYKRQSKKLEKLKSRTDIEAQRAAAKKYNRRAAISAGVGLGAAGVAVGSKMLNQHLKGIAKGLMDQKMSAADALRREADRSVRELWKNDAQAYTNGKWNGKGYSQSTWDKVDKIVKDYDTKDTNLMRERSQIKDKFNKGSEIRKIVSYAATGVAAVSAGVAAYNKVQAHLANKRTTEAGHAKAVAKYEAQYSKMLNQFGNTPYAELLKKQQS